MLCVTTWRHLCIEQTAENDHVDHDHKVFMFQDMFGMLQMFILLLVCQALTFEMVLFHSQEANAFSTLETVMARHPIIGF